MDSNYDFEWWKRIQNNDFPAYEVIYRKYLPIIFSMIFKHIGNREEAEDLTQEVFLNIWARRADIQLEGRLFSYIYGTARYKVLEYLRSQKRTAKHEAEWNRWISDIDMVESDESAARLIKIRSEAIKLPPQMRKIYEMNMEQQLHSSEIAEKLDISEHTVKKHLVNIKKRLRNAAIMLAFILSILPNR